MSERIRVLFADDHPIMRAGLAATIGTQPDMAVIAEAEDGRQAVELHRRHHPDVTIMDLRMPAMNGVEATRAIRGESPGARIIVLTTYDGDEDIHRALEAGASSYLMKHTVRKDLVRAIRVVHEGKHFIPAEVASRLAERDDSPALSPREMDVLRLIARGLSNREIGEVLSVSPITVRTYVTNILRKLSVSGRTEAVTLALQRGILHLE
jgi:DNA-binding NarL/FixJ family response regulator